MTSPSATKSEWTTATRSRIRQLQDGLLHAAEWARESGADAYSTELLLQPYREMIETLYERDLPLSKLADESDLLLHGNPSATDVLAPMRML